MKWKSENIFILSIIFFSGAFVFFLFIAQWPQWWKWIIFERTPMTWLESVLLVLTGFTAFLNSFIAHYQQEKNLFWLWFLFGTGFIGLALDERFAIHERIRDSILAPRNIKLPWTSPGDIALLLIMIGGLLLLPRFLKLFHNNSTAKKSLLIGVGLTIVAVISDSFDVHGLSLSFQRWLQFFEELLETSAQICFFTAVFLCFSKRMKQSMVLKEKE